MIKINETEKHKILRSSNYNYNFDKLTGYFQRWGKTPNDDPQWGLPEIADIEITTICHGVRGRLCPFCYKGNSPKGKYMTLDTFKKIFHKLPRSVTQIAFGVDSHCNTNPDWFEIFKYCRENDYNKVVPNVTVADIDNTVADKLRTVCGAVAVSRYDNADACYDTVKKLTDRGMTQINIHIMVSKETYTTVNQTLFDRMTDPRLSKLNAIVLLSLKQKRRGINYTPLPQDMFNHIVETALDNKISIGFDSCSCHKFLQTVKQYPEYKQYEQVSEPCESTCFSVYIDVDGYFYPCSFTPNTVGWYDGINVIHSNDFINDVWMNPRTVEFRKKLIKGGRICPIYTV